MQLGQSLAKGSYIVGFLNQSGVYGATANSGAILETARTATAAATAATASWGSGTRYLGHDAVGLWGSRSFDAARPRHPSGAEAGCLRRRPIQTARFTTARPQSRAVFMSPHPLRFIGATLAKYRREKDLFPRL